ncbi:MAG: TolC family protein [Blastocatellia bacterium]|nr:TolC family protein [Blastocatellia bacterium]
MSSNLRATLGRLCLCLLAMSSLVLAQEAVSPPMRLEAAVEAALRNYPSIRAEQAQAAAAGTGTEFARNAYLPRVEIDWQQTRGTRNNVFGQFFPQTAIPPISGPLIADSSFAESAWGSGGGLLVAWEPFDFGLRKAGVSLAERVAGEAQARVAVTRLDVAAAAADAFLTVLAMEQAVRAAQANVERMEAFSKSVHVLVDNELRPGADASRTDVELAAARSVWIQAKEKAALARAALAEAIGQAGQAMTLDAGPLLDSAGPAASAGEAAPASEPHPLISLRKASLEIVFARQRVLDRSFFPKFQWQTAVFGRGSGARTDGRLLGGRGFFPDTPNWGTGLTISFAPTDLFHLRARRREESHRLAAEQARYDQTVQQLKAEADRARAIGDAARELAGNTPRQLQAARETELRVRKRYEAELGTVIEVADAQRLLAQAEVADALARLGVWRARLLDARARGDLTPFLDLLRNATSDPNRSGRSGNGQD